MKFKKSELLEAVQQLNGDNKEYRIEVEGSKIITSLKWQDETFFSKNTLTDAMRDFSYTVQILDNGKYTEIKQKQTDKAFPGEEYKKPVKDFLKKSGCKKKMSKWSKILIALSVVLVILIATVGVLLVTIANKKPISAQDFRAKSEAEGYQVSALEDMNRFENKVGVKFETLGEFEESALIAFDSEDNFRILYLDYPDARSAEKAMARCKSDLDKKALREGKPQNTVIVSEHYDRYTIDTPRGYRYLARIDDTMIMVATKAKNKTEVKAFIDALGY